MAKCNYYLEMALNWFFKFVGIFTKGVRNIRILDFASKNKKVLLMS